MDAKDQHALNDISTASFRLGEAYGLLMKHRHTHPEEVAAVYQKMLMYMPMEEILKLLHTLGDTIMAMKPLEDE